MDPVEFIGGPVDGQRMLMPELLPIYRVPSTYVPRVDDSVVPGAQAEQPAIEYKLVTDFRGRPIKNKGRFQYKLKKS